MFSLDHRRHEARFGMNQLLEMCILLDYYLSLFLSIVRVYRLHTTGI